MRSTLLKDCRNAQGLSTTQLAHRLGVAQSTVVRLEQSEARGTISLESLRKVAAALGCSVSYELQPNSEQQARTIGKKATTARIRGRKFSPLAEELGTRETAVARASAPSQRFKRGIELSNFARRLKCSNGS